MADIYTVRSKIQEAHDEASLAAGVEPTSAVIAALTAQRDAAEVALAAMTAERDVALAKIEAARAALA